MFIAILALLLACHGAIAQSDSGNWRFWNTADGMKESFTAVITATPRGDILIRHGDVASLNLLNGYRVSNLPDIHTVGRPYADKSGRLYTFDKSGLAILNHGNWGIHPIPEFFNFSFFQTYLHYRWFEYPTAGMDLEHRVAALPIGDGRVAVMLPDSIFEWTEDSGSRRTIRRARDTSLGEFIDVEAAGEGEVWVSGKNGLASLSLEGDSYKWRELPTPPQQFSRFVFPSRTAAGGTIVSATGASGAKRLLREQGDQWRTVFVGDGRKLRGWEGDSGRLWIAHGDNLLVSKNSAIRRAEIPSEISGRILDILPGKAGVFWVATSQVLARYSPSLWQHPNGAPELDLVNAIAEDSSGRIWFASGNQLVSWASGEWRSVNLPHHDVQDVAKTSGICPLPDGRLLLVTDNPDHLLEMDTRNGSFRSIPAPPGRRFGWIQPRNPSSVWVQTLMVGGSSSRLEIFDGAGFHAVPGLESLPITDIRGILEDRHGALWIGGTDRIMVVRGGHPRLLGKEDGLPETAAFSFFQAPDGKLYIGQRDHLSMFDGKSFRVLRKGLDRARAFAIGPDGTLWIASGTGVQRYRNGEWIVNAAEEGLPSSAVYTVFADRTGHVWAGTTRGLSQFHPESDRDPPITFIQEERNLRETPPDGEVRLNFSGLDRWKQTPKNRLLFSWKLDGDDWGPFETRSFTAIRSLPSGEHTFAVRAMDRNGNIDPRPATFAFSVLLPWYREDGFYVVAGLLALAILVLVYLTAGYHATLRSQSRRDPLTKLPNRLAFEEILAQALTAAKTRKRSLAVAFIDLDGFKQVNDLYGHKAGDILLGQVGRAIGKSLRANDTVARIGGDEFAVVMPGIDNRENVTAIAGRILVSLRDCSTVEGHTVHITGSIGISLYPEQGDDAPTLIRNADIAMYQSKAGSGDSFLFYNPSMNMVDARGKETVSMIRCALANEHLRLVFQPIVDHAGSVVQMEALVRICDPVRGVVPPDEFIPVAEQSGLIRDVGAWVFRNAAKQARAWRDAGYDVRVAVNVSPVELETPGFVERALSALSAEGLPTSAVVLEITESTAVRNQSAMKFGLDRLHDAGLTVALDDFGTGYSSLSALDRLPVESIKIDRSFTSQIAVNRRTREVVAQTVLLAHTLGLQTVLEGIEEPGQFDLGRAMGCDLFQGYLIAPPLEPADASEYLASRVCVNSFG